MRVEIYSDIACPWCYVGHRRLANALEELPAAERPQSVLRPFQLDPTLAETPIPLGERLRRKFGEQVVAVTRQVRSVAEQEGLDLRFNKALAVNTLKSHRLLYLAEQAYGAEAQHRLAELLFEAHFTNGRNVADNDVLVDLAVGAGLEAEQVAAFLTSGEGRREVERMIAYAQRVGIRAVPTFVFEGRYAVQGAQPKENLLEVMREVASQARIS